MLRVTINRLLGRDHVTVLAKSFSGVQVTRILGECRRRALQSNAVPRLKHLAGIPSIDVVPVDRTGLSQFLLAHAVVESGAHDSVRQPLGKSVLPQVDQLSGKVGVSCGGCRL